MIETYVPAFCVLVLITICGYGRAQRPFIPEDFYTDKHLSDLREEVRDIFYHAYEGYLNYAYPLDELQPLTCQGVDTWGSYSLTLIDALDTLVVLGNYSEFKRVVGLVTERKDFNEDINVSVFETNIRVVGGLLSAHLLSHKAGLDLEPGWPCNGPLLRLAEDAARRLLPAFNSSTGMPYGTVNLRYGVPQDETPVTCTAGVGTFILEFGVLSRLTQNPVYEEVAMKAIMALWDHRSSLGLLGNHINVENGQWIATDAGIGAAVDSYYEYLVKGSALLSRPELIAMFFEHLEGIERYMKKDDWYFWVSMTKGAVSLPVFQNLEAYWPGVLSTLGRNSEAIRSVLNYHQVLKHVGFVPEMYDVHQGEIRAQREGYPLRPELIESLVFLYRSTKDKNLLAIGEDVLRAIQHSTRTPCGYATVKDTRDHRLEDRMESFFLAETTKYMYLLFDPENFIHGPVEGISGVPHRVASRTCFLDTGAYIFNTEAHPLDTGALDCCKGPTERDLWQDAWFPRSERSFEKADTIESSTTSPTAHYSSRKRSTCPATSWESLVSPLRRQSTAQCPAVNKTGSMRGGGNKSIGNSSSLFSLLSCPPAHFVERLCIAGEVCEI